MRLTITQLPDKIEEFEVSDSLELGDLRALLELNFDIPADRQRLHYNGKPLDGNSKTLQEHAIDDHSMIYISDNAQYQQQQQQQQVATSSSGLSPQMEAHRQQVLQNPQLMEQLRQTHPEIAQAVQNNPSEFARLMGVLQQQQRAIQNERQRELANLEADPFDVESQRRIEEMIRQENVMKNMETALELNPESFASVSMLYISVIVNGTPIKALVDSGAQATIMSHSCAERCGIMRLIDTRFAGEARGVGRAKILGRVHNARMDVGGLELLCSFTVMEGAHLGLLFGLDMLKRHLACIDLKRNALVIDENVIEFLPEHLIPKSLDDDDPVDGVAPVVPPTAAGAEAAGVAAATPPRPSTSDVGALTGGAAVSDIAQRQEYQQKQQQIQQQIQAQSPRQAQQQQPAQQQQQAQFSESSIKALMDLGVSRQEAIRNLEAAGGNLDIAASLIFS